MIYCRDPAHNASTSYFCHQFVLQEASHHPWKLRSATASLPMTVNSLCGCGQLMQLQPLLGRPHLVTIIESVMTYGIRVIFDPRNGK